MGANALAKCVISTEITDLKQETRDFSYGIKIKTDMSSEHFNEKGDGPYRGFDY